MDEGCALAHESKISQPRWNAPRLSSHILTTFYNAINNKVTIARDSQKEMKSHAPQTEIDDGRGDNFAGYFMKTVIIFLYARLSLYIPFISSLL